MTTKPTSGARTRGARSHAGPAHRYTTSSTTARRRPGCSARAVLVVALLGGISAVWSGPAVAQGIPTPTITGPQAALDDCLAEQRERGVTEATAARRCAPDQEAFNRCLQERQQSDTPVQEAIIGCLTEQVEDAETGPAVTTPAGPTVTAPSATAPSVSAPAVTDPGAPGATTAMPDGGIGIPARPLEVSGDGASGDTGTLTVVLIAVAAFVLGGGAAALALRSRRGQALTTSYTQPVPAGGPGPATPPSGPTGPSGSTGPSEPTPEVAAAVAGEPERDAETDRRVLIEAVIEAGDVATSDAVRITLAERLQTVGVAPITVDAGTRFDPGTHRGVHAETAPTEADEGTVARTDRIGWSDRGRVLRPPEVIVFRKDES